MFDLMLFVTEFAAIPIKATIPSSNNTNATLIVDVICALNTDMPECFFFINKKLGFVKSLFTLINCKINT